MSEKLLRILLSELETVRVMCQNPKCHKIVEMPIAELAKSTDTTCKFCNADFDPMHTGKSALADFARAAVELQKLRKVVEVAFELKDQDEKRPR